MGSRPLREPSQVLIVEGRDDQAVAEALLRTDGFEVRFAVRPKRSVGSLISSMGAEVKVSGRTAVGFVFDANSNPGSRWADVVSALKGAYPVPRSPNRNGTIMDGPPKVGIWMMPDNHSAGELEDLVAKMVAPADRVWPLAEAFITGLPEPERQYALSHPTKAILYAWLATRRRPGRMGTAIADGDLETSHALAKRFGAWLGLLFA